MDYKYEMICCIVNLGFSEAVMDAAREFGARGGTVIHAKGTANKEAEKLFKIPIEQEKEMVLILVPTEIKEDILHALYKEVGLATAGQGIAFSLPVESVVGLSEAPAVKDGQADDKKAENGKESDKTTERVDDKASE